jgi:beta-phosphoglucomutase-like phosphatase (HAD superfamily)
VSDGGTDRDPAPYRGLIFDFNGVLWWDNALQEEAWRLFAGEVRERPFTEAEMAVHMHGRPNSDVLAYLLDRPLEAAQVAAYTQQKEAIYRRLCLAQGDGFRLSPGAVTLLDFLQAHAIPHTIATASEKSNLDFFIHHLQLKRWFDPAQIVYDDGTFPGKPAPDIYQKAAANLGLPPSACVVVEDSQAGLRAAHAAGIGYLVALGSSLDLPGDVAVDAVVVDLDQLPRRSLFLRQPGS